MIESQAGRRVLVTGVGVIAPNGIGKQRFWDGLSAPVEPATVRPVPEFDPGWFGLSRVEARRLDRFAQFAVGAAAMALVDAGLLPEVTAAGSLTGVDPQRVAVLVGSGSGGATTRGQQLRALAERGQRAVSPYLVPMTMVNAAAAAISIRWRTHGLAEAVSTACATGTLAIGAAARWVAAGRAELALAGSAEAALTDGALAGYLAARALSPTGRSAPFDVDRDGFCAGEGAAVLVLEEAAHAAARGVRGYAEIAGVGASSDAHHVTAPAPDAAQAIACMRSALVDARVAPGEVTHVNAHASATILNDQLEARAIQELFGVPGPAVTAIKGVTGHGQGAAGAIEAVAVALAYSHRMLPPVIG
ncbi:MAG TPA: beta-ketoacyl-[acyl-carrier-protein] synthase family protein, partial [Micromonosporaceae bacterium]|nr:beta-ketoacyl-[acyl-carrier-protein] synthase family protein [Micromonosporaceae bacterium]